MTREELLAFEPFKFYIQYKTDVYHLSAATAVKNLSEECGEATVFADGHEEFLRRVPRQTVTVEGVMPFFRDDPRLSNPDKHMAPRQLAQAIDGLLYERRIVRVFCNYLNVYADCMIRSFSWEPVPDSEGDLRYRLTFTVGNGTVHLPRSSGMASA